jgi:GntR family negative regulator for fad regulon and positive regulator of fabA
MERDGWISIQQGKSTVVRDIWTEGGLNVLSSLARHGYAGFENHIPFDFIPRLLEVRLALAPAYARAATACDENHELTDYLSVSPDLNDTPATYASFDWRLHHQLTVASCNPIYTLILNGFAELYATMAQVYFAQPEARTASHRFYVRLLEAIQQRDADDAETITREAMAESLVLWEAAQCPR